MAGIDPIVVHLPNLANFTFDGNYHTIDGIKMIVDRNYKEAINNPSLSKIGLFDFGPDENTNDNFNRYRIKNTGFTNVDYDITIRESDGVSGSFYIGVIAAEMDKNAQAERVFATGKIKFTNLISAGKQSAKVYMGGLFGTVVGDGNALVLQMIEHAKEPLLQVSMIPIPW